MSTYYLYVLEFPNNKEYVGISNNASQRLKRHIIKYNSGSSLPVHRAIRKYGADNIKQRILCIGDREYIADLEVAMISAKKTRNRLFGYNVSLGGDISPMHDPEVAARVSKTKRALFEDDDYKRRVIRPAIEASLDPAIRARLLETIRRPGVSAAKSEKLTGRKASEETIARMRAAQAVPEHRVRLSIAVRAAWADPVLRAQQSERFKGRPVSAEVRAKISATLMGHTCFWKGQKRPEMAEKIRDLVWITDGVRCRRIPKGTIPEDGWRPGRKRDSRPIPVLPETF